MRAMSQLLWDGPEIPKPVASRRRPVPGTASGRFDRFQFDQPLEYLLALPLATVIAFAVNGTLPGLTRPFHIWIHEFGHATVAWLSGRRALPLPIGWTSFELDRSTVVYGALLFLLGVLGYTAWREKVGGALVFTSALVVVQFVMTWILSFRTIDLWITFGGIGGQFYLSALLIVLFYVPLPDRFRWDFWRYAVLAVAASSFWETFTFWKQVAMGQAGIPWGSILGAGDAGGDMNRLANTFGWPDRRIVSTYNTLGNVCLLLLLCVYGWFLFRERHRVLASLRGGVKRGIIGDDHDGP